MPGTLCERDHPAVVLLWLADGAQCHVLRAIHVVAWDRIAFLCQAE